MLAACKPHSLESMSQRKLYPSSVHFLVFSCVLNTWAIHSFWKRHAPWKRISGYKEQLASTVDRERLSSRVVHQPPQDGQAQCCGSSLHCAEGLGPQTRIEPQSCLQVASQTELQPILLAMQSSFQLPKKSPEFLQYLVMRSLYCCPKPIAPDGREPLRARFVDYPCSEDRCAPDGFATLRFNAQRLAKARRQEEQHRNPSFRTCIHTKPQTSLESAPCHCAITKQNTALLKAPECRNSVSSNRSGIKSL